MVKVKFVELLLALTLMILSAPGASAQLFEMSIASQQNKCSTMEDVVLHFTFENNTNQIIWLPILKCNPDRVWFETNDEAIIPEHCEAFGAGGLMQLDSCGVLHTSTRIRLKHTNTRGKHFMLKATVEMGQLIFRDSIRLFSVPPVGDETDHLEEYLKFEKLPSTKQYDAMKSFIHAHPQSRYCDEVLVRGYYLISPDDNINEEFDFVRRSIEKYLPTFERQQKYLSGANSYYQRNNARLAAKFIQMAPESEIKRALQRNIASSLKVEK